MKRLLALILSVALVLSICALAGCGNDPVDQTTGSSTPKEKAYWEKALKRFWLKKIPFVDWFMR